MNAIKRTMATVLLLGALSSSWAVNGGALTQSLILPGMGQMASGGHHVYIGLGFLCAEVAAIHAVFNAMSKADTYQEETVIYQRQYDLATSYDERLALRTQWDRAYTNADTKSKEMMLWATLAGGIWAANALEAFFFSPSREEEAAIENTKPHLAMTTNGENVQLRWTGRF